MKLNGISVFVSVTALVLVLTEVSAKPVTDIRKLPSITIDTLYPKAEEDNEPSESVGMGLVSTLMSGTKMFQQTVRPRHEATYVTLFRLPWRIARSISQTGYGMARGFMDAFQEQFLETYKSMQQNVIPQASQAMADWANPPKPNLDSPWLDGGV